MKQEDLDTPISSNIGAGGVVVVAVALIILSKRVHSQWALTVHCEVAKVGVGSISENAILRSCSETPGARIWRTHANMARPRVHRIDLVRAKRTYAGRWQHSLDDMKLAKEVPRDLVSVGDEIQGSAVVVAEFPQSSASSLHISRCLELISEVLQGWSEMLAITVRGLILVFIVTIRISNRA
ncbi:hypothetical protein Q9L58_008525 [Maublancomyces gigas]|uniref:Uncharacterized protein n=1 Tax=Discina gigas TaxID=1032678 RepID=A0ABR3G9G5_9PEZI